MKINLYLTPLPFSNSSLENKTVIVIDVLRSSTSICTALNAGARAVIPTTGPGEAGEMWTKIGGDMAILAGEQNGVRIENFQLGNSPIEFTKETVENKYVIMATTNGTPVFNKVTNTSVVISGALVNISKVSDMVAQENKDLVIACSGKEGQFSFEDTICGGMLISLLAEKFDKDISVNDAGNLAMLLYRTNKEKLKESIRQSEHGKFLESIGYSEDIAFASEIDSIPVLPILKDGQLILKC